MYTPNSLDQTLTQAIIPYNQAYAETILAYVTPACLVFNTYTPIGKGGVSKWETKQKSSKLFP